jgi:hypothetical protein
MCNKTKLASLTLCWPYFYSLGNINHKKPFMVCGYLMFARTSVQMQRWTEGIATHFIFIYDFIVIGDM